ncbi:MAG: arsenate reductase ArsC [Woeseiaceae bacterium]|nr:arsenate reductase ArsC [Woeseiaceae bacterium]
MTGNTAAKPISLLVLCTGNSCRSILAEVLINELGQGRFRAFSAGSHPAGAVNENAVEILTKYGFDSSGVASKSWDKFNGPDAPDIDIVITVCDNAAGESCPLWNGSPVKVHWGIPDPASATGDAIEPAFEKALAQLRQRIELMIELPLEDFDPRMRAESLRRLHDAVLSQEAA